MVQIINISADMEKAVEGVTKESVINMLVTMAKISGGDIKISAGLNTVAATVKTEEETINLKQAFEDGLAAWDNTGVKFQITDKVEIVKQNDPDLESVIKTIEQVHANATAQVVQALAAI